MCFSNPPILTEETVEVDIKHIAELEKENAELKGLKDVATLIRANNDTVTTLMQLNNNNVALRKENAELKHTTSTLRQEKDNSNAHAKAMEIVAKTRTDQLTKAKEHIQTLISCLIDWVQEGDKDYCHIADAKQFISEVEK
jgi:hypothetical protein